jgi:hypothetical protein
MNPFSTEWSYRSSQFGERLQHIGAIEPAAD